MKTRTLLTTSLVALAIGCGIAGSAAAQNRGYGDRGYSDRGSSRWNRGYQSRTVIPAGTNLYVRLDNTISTDDVHAGDTWTGTISQSVGYGNQVVIPAGTPVSGVVTTSVQGTHDSQAQMSLALRQVSVGGQYRRLNADTEPIVAGSQRAHKLGAIAGGAAVGALIGHTVARDHHGTLIGGLLGGATGYGLTRHAYRTLVLKPGTIVTFTTSSDMMARR